MKRFLSLFLVLLFLPLIPLSQAASAPAAEIEAVVRNSKDKDVDAAALRDGSDATGMVLKKAAKGGLILLIPEGKACSSLYVRMTAIPSSAELQKMGDAKKWETLLKISNPGAEFVISAGSVSGKLQLLFTFPASVSCTVTELRCFTAGDLPADVHAWKNPDEADVLLVCDSAGDFPAELAASLTSSGADVAAAFLTGSESPLNDCDALWAAGVRTVPGYAKGKKAAAEVTLTQWLRAYRPRLLVTGDGLTDSVAAASANAADPMYKTEEAAVTGVYALPEHCGFTDDAAGIYEALPPRSDDALRAMCASPFASALYTDPAAIPYPSDRLQDGYLPDGSEEYVYEDKENGLWAYVSQTLQVEIVKYTMPEVPHTWFEADVRFRPEAESFRQHTYVNAKFEGQQIYPETLAQTSRLVFAINGDYYPYREEKKTNVGNIIRQGKVLHTYNRKKSLKYPNLDTVALRDDGSISVYAGAEYTAEELLAQGNVHDALSFGPYLARDGRLRVYNGNSAMTAEPRCAFGTVEPGHYRFVMVEGKMPKGGEQGMNLIQLAQLLYARGVNDAINIDGGSTAVMIFMGHRLNRTGKAVNIGSPRNQHELFGVGASELVHTDMFNGK